MAVADFTQPKGGCDVTVQKFLVEADPAADANTYKVYLLMPLASRAEAEVVAAMLPGLADVFDRAGEDDNWKSTMSVKPAESLRVVLAAKDAGVGVRQGVVKPGEVVIQGTAELVEMRASQSKRARAVLVRLVFRGQAAAVAERLADNLGRLVAMTFERAQGVLSFTSPSKAPPLRPGMVVAASLPNGEQIVGRLVEIDGDEISLQECGTEHTVDAAAVFSAIAFSDDGDTSAALTDYAERCERRGVAVSWAALIAAVSRRSGLEGDAMPASGTQVTADDVEAAVALLAGASEGEATAQEPMGEVVALPTEERPKRQPKARARA